MEGFFSTFWKFGVCARSCEGLKVLTYNQNGTGPYSPAQFKPGAASTDGHRMLADISWVHLTYCAVVGCHDEQMLLPHSVQWQAGVVEGKHGAAGIS